MSYESEPIEATVAELRPRMKNISITFKVMEMGEARDVTSRRDDTDHRVLDAIVGDSTGTVTVPCWDDTIDIMKEGETYTLTNGYTGLFRGNLRLNIGRYGKLEEANEPIEEVNQEVDMSAEEHEDYRRRDYGGRRGGGGYGGGNRRSSGGSYGGRDRRSGGYDRRDNRRRY
jgi:replication factor A1